MVDGDPQLAVEEPSTAPVVFDGDTELVMDADGVGDTEGMTRDSGTETLLDGALTEAETEPEVRAVRIPEVGADDPSDDFWDTPVAVGRAPDVRLVKDGAAVSGVPVLLPVKVVTGLYAVPAEAVMLALGEGAREGSAVASEVLKLALGVSVGGILASPGGALILALGEAVGENAVPIGVVILTLGETVREAAVSPTEVVKLAFGARVGETLPSSDEAVMLALGENVRETPVAPSEVVRLAFGGKGWEILASPDEVVMLAFGEGVVDIPVANEVLRFVLRDDGMVGDGVAEMPVPNEVLMFALWDVTETPVARELLNNGVMGGCSVVSGKGQAQVYSLDGVAVGDKSDVVLLSAGPSGQLQWKDEL